MEQKFSADLAPSDEGAVCLVQQLAAELAEELDSAWAVPMAAVGTRFVSLAVFGDAPDVRACALNAATILAHYGALLGNSGVIAQTDCTVIPLRVKGKILAVVVLGPKKSGNIYSVADRRFMTEGAAQTAGKFAADAFGRRFAVAAAASQA